jgi:hypothetical protein
MSDEEHKGQGTETRRDPVAVSGGLLMNYISIARDYREQCKDLRERNLGIVLVNIHGKVYGWKNQLRDPHSETPGSVAVTMDGRVFEAAGGDYYQGAEAWVRREDLETMA